MRVLVGWDVEPEIDLLSMYLMVDDNEVLVVRTPEEMVLAANNRQYDVVLFPITFPDAERSFELFENLHAMGRAAPIVVAARPGETYPLCRFIRNGARSYLYRDADGEYLFLVQTLLASTIAGKRAEQAQALAARLREEIDSVRKLQESILPRSLRALPGYEVVARYEPSQIRMSEDLPVVLAGGDYYHVFQIDNRQVLLVGDASGHGMKACMSIMSMHTLINQMHDGLRGSPAEFVAEINRRLCSDDLIQGEGGFITLLYAVLEGHVLRWTSAGHPLPLLHDLDTDEFRELGDPRKDSGPPLGLFEEAEYATVESELPVGGRLLIYTDGIVEAFPDRPEKVEFGMDGLKQTLSHFRGESLAATMEALFADSFDFTEGAGRHDDTSVLLLDRKK